MSHARANAVCKYVDAGFVDQVSNNDVGESRYFSAASVNHM
jgi:hypothetical protein